MKKNIALLAGGYSGEYEISIKTAITIANHLDPNLYQVYKIIVTKDSWLYTTNDGQEITIDKNDFTLLVNNEQIKFDAVFIAIHGTPGEDGKIQGYLDMLAIPYTTCSAIVSAVTFNKSYCNKVVKALDKVAIANSVHLIKGNRFSVGTILEQLKLPVFVKPNECGSSIGISKVKTVEQLLPAIDKAFSEDNQVLIEEFIAGRELTIGVYMINNDLRVLPATEIKSQNEFFDYEAKYTTGKTNEITPAPIPDDVKNQLERKATQVYQHLNCRGVVRMDFILQDKTNQLYFLEVNTMPGQSENSIIPQQVRAAGMDLGKFYSDLIEDCITNKKY
ncbi:MAG: D-alanine--D-alanine ligase [Bacteroidota bacterium]